MCWENTQKKRVGRNTMNLNYIRYALEISRCGSINRAAKRLYISQSSLRRGIKELEAETGIQIFSRSSTGIETTHQGEEFLKHAAKLDMQYKHLEEMYFSGQKPDVLHLSVSSVRFAVANRAMINVYQRHQDSEFQNICFAEGSQEEVIEHVYDGLFSLGILIASGDKRDYWRATAKSRELDYSVLATRQPYIFVGEQNPVAQGESVCIEQLINLPHATMAQSDVSPLLYCSGVNNYDYRTVAKRILVSDRAGLYDLLRETNAYYIGLNLGQTSLCTPGIRFLPLTNAVDIDCALVYSKQHRLTGIEEEYIAEMKHLLGET